MKVKTDYTGGAIGYLTAGKVYEVTNISTTRDGGTIVCDDGNPSFILLGHNACAHLDHKATWEVVEDTQESL